MAVAVTWNVDVGGRPPTTESVVLATPATVVGATGARVPMALVTVKVAVVPLGAGLPFTVTLTARPSDVPGSSTLLVG